MRRNLHGGWLLAIVLLALAWPAAGEPPKEKPPQSRTLIGQVTDQDERPLPKAVVYLKNSKTLTIKTYIADNQGNYRFAALSPDIDYEVHAEFEGHRSSTRTLSSFDSRSQVVFNLKINLNK